LLRRIASLTGRLELTVDHGAYRQAEILSALAQHAISEGADWVLPSDADEFLWLRRGASLDLLYGRTDIGGFAVPVRNFLQARPIRQDWPGSLATMCVSAVPQGLAEDGFALVTDGKLPFVRISYPTKLLVRASPSLQFDHGHHNAEGLAGPLIPLEGGEKLHAPIRSFGDLHRRVEAGRRVGAVSSNPSWSWHLKRLAHMKPSELEREWRENSFHPLRPLAAGVAQLDWRLALIALQQARFRRIIYGSAKRSMRSKHGGNHPAHIERSG
jgi:hypothetical protein